MEDDGEGILFNVYCYNVQPFVCIDYATGKSWLESEDKPDTASSSGKTTYVLNTSSKKFHEPDCGGVKQIDQSNKETVTDTRDSLIQSGYSPCGICKP